MTDDDHLSYPERMQARAAEGASLTIYVPKPGQQGSIRPRSAIVGDPKPGTGEVLAYLEAWIHGPAQYGHLDARGLWEAGVVHAAGRCFTRYPTVARAACMLHDLIAVGTIEADGNRITITDEEAVQTWLTS